MTAVEGYRPTLQSIERILIRGNIHAVFVGIVNALLGSNYLFIAHKPATANLLDVLPPWPLYLPILEAIALAMIGLLYLPFAIKDLKAKQATPDTVELTQAPPMHENRLRSDIPITPQTWRSPTAPSSGEPAP